MITIPPPTPTNFPPALLFADPAFAEGWIAAGVALAALVASGFFSTLRFALAFSHGPRVLRGLPEGPVSERLARSLERADRLASSAAISKIVCDLVLIVSAVGLAAATDGHDRGTLAWTEVALMVALLAPVLLLMTEALPRSVARARGDSLLVRVLPTFDWLQRPLAWVVHALDSIRRGLLRALGIPESAATSRDIVEGLRDVIEDASLTEDLDEAEREILGNVLDFGDVDVAAVMTPRTEVHAVDVEDGIEGALKHFAEFRHSRVPIFDESIDTIIGTVHAIDLTRLVAKGELESARLRDIMRPPLLVPETKQISELLGEFRTQRQKIAIVLDEYGGTAGIVTIADVIAEIVGDIEDEEGEAVEVVRELGDGLFEVHAGVHVSEVNESLGLELPEESDFETLGGFVLSALGHLPKEGESFVHADVEYRVIEATDRRIYKVSVRRGA